MLPDLPRPPHLAGPGRLQHPTRALVRRITHHDRLRQAGVRHLSRPRRLPRLVRRRRGSPGPVDDLRRLRRRIPRRAAHATPRRGQHLRAVPRRTPTHAREHAASRGRGARECIRAAAARRKREAS